jgi:hypothetical protein
MKPSSISWSLEAQWLAATVLFTSLLILPIWIYLPEFPFIWHLFYLVFWFLTAARYLFLLRFSPFGYWEIGKFLLMVVCLPVLLFSSSTIGECQTWIDERNLIEVSEAIQSMATKVSSYARTATIFFGSGAFVVSIVLPFYLAGSIWRSRNLNKV